jgi:pyruvate dehydrogenase E2 component (dihydrolipoamide acetyltransferase)
MAEMIMPKAGDAMTEGKVVRWYKQKGDAVKKGEPIVEIETDKVNLDLEAESDGTIGELKAKEGDMVPVGNVLVNILAEGEQEPAEKEPAAAAPQQKSEKVAAGTPEGESPSRRSTDRKDSVKHTTGEYQEAIEQKGPRRDRTSPESSQAAPEAAQEGEPGERRRSSPLARRMAKEMGVSLDAVRGSGPGGRIVAADVKNAPGSNAAAPKAAATAPQAAPRPAAPPMIAANAPVLETKIIPLSAMRRTIAKRLAESTGPIPHFYLTADYDVTNLISVRQQLIEMTGTKVSLNDFIIRAIALALRHHPMVNASWGDDAITQHGEVHIGVAVATPDGLITPVIRNADQKAVSDIASEVRALADKAKNRRLKPDEYQGSTFTISNLGAWGIEEFTAIINPPNAAILAIGTA